MGLADFAADLADVLSEVGPAVVIGYSMGGLLTQMVAADPRTRHLVRAAALMCSVPPRGIVALSGPVLRASTRYLRPMVTGATFIPSRDDADAMMMNGVPAEDRDRTVPAVHRRLRPGRPADGHGRRGSTAAPSPAPSSWSRANTTASRLPRSSRRWFDATARPTSRVAGHAHLVAIEPGWEAVEAAILDRLEPFAPVAAIAAG